MREYVVDHNATQAAIRAGYHKPSAGFMGNSLLKNPLVMAELAKEEQALADRTRIDQDRVTSMLLDSYDAARADKQHGPAVRAVELLGKQRGMFKDVIVNEGLSDSQLIERLAKDDPEMAAVLEKALVPKGFQTSH